MSNERTTTDLIFELSDLSTVSLSFTADVSASNDELLLAVNAHYCGPNWQNEKDVSFEYLSEQQMLDLYFYLKSQLLKKYAGAL